MMLFNLKNAWRTSGGGRRAAMMVAAAALVVAGAWWCRGRGYRDWVVRHVLPAKVHRVPPEVALARPGEGAANVRTDVTVVARVKSSSPIDPASVNPRSVYLVRTADQVRIDAAVNLDSRAGKIILHPAHPLAPATDFTL
jgi:hypothetical protein